MFLSVSHRDIASQQSTTQRLNYTCSARKIICLFVCLFELVLNVPSTAIMVISGLHFMGLFPSVVVLIVLCLGV